MPVGAGRVGDLRRKPKTNIMDLYQDTPASSSSRPRIVLNNTAPFTPELIQSSLSRSSDPAKIYATRIKGRQILLENPVRASKSRQDAEEKKRERKRAAAQVKKQWAPSAKHEGLWKLKDSESKYVTRVVA